MQSVSFLAGNGVRYSPHPWVLCGFKRAIARDGENVRRMEDSLQRTISLELRFGCHPDLWGAQILTQEKGREKKKCFHIFTRISDLMIIRSTTCLR